MAVRQRLLDLGLALAGFGEALAGSARGHRSTLMPDFTYLQHAQATTLGHYLLGFAYPLVRDLDRSASTLSGRPQPGRVGERQRVADPHGSRLGRRPARVRRGGGAHPGRHVGTRPGGGADVARGHGDDHDRPPRRGPPGVRHRGVRLRRVGRCPQPDERDHAAEEEPLCAGRPARRGARCSARGRRWRPPA